MPIIVVAGRKGGIGKSTIAGNLAGEFAAMGRTVAVLDADPQHSLVAWAAQGDGMLARCVEKVKDDLRVKVRAAEKTANVILIDTPPGLPDAAYQAILLADLVLLPCGPSPLDLFPLKEALGLALKARAERGSKKPRIRFVPDRGCRGRNERSHRSRVLPGLGGSCGI
jgi:chromosome partitioning protein